MPHCLAGGVAFSGPAKITTSASNQVRAPAIAAQAPARAVTAQEGFKGVWLVLARHWLSAMQHTDGNKLTSAACRLLQARHNTKRCREFQEEYDVRIAVLAYRCSTAINIFRAFSACYRPIVTWHVTNTHSNAAPLNPPHELSQMVSICAR